MHNTFVSYMLDFYGKGGIYDYGMTADEVLAGTLVYIGVVGLDKFEGDSVDREAVRDIILDMRPETN